MSIWIHVIVILGLGFILYEIIESIIHSIQIHKRNKAHLKEIEANK